ncbi:MAG: ribose 5-phosphate isomerase B [Phycisphaerales bacterium]|nr:ribose 5-phosphate isomerase B [Phycisphaerales bacterium]
MKVAVACDHAAFTLKQDLLPVIVALGHEPTDLGTNSLEAVDYPDFAAKLALEVLSGRCRRGILLCGSGVGASVAANKFPGIRAGNCADHYSAHQGVEHDDMNVLVLGGRIIGLAVAQELVSAFLSAEYTNEPRHARRLAKVLKIEADAARLANLAVHSPTLTSPKEKP